MYRISTFGVVGVLVAILANAMASEVVIPLDAYHLSYPLTIETGDTVTWQTVNDQTNFVAEYGSDWSSAALTNAGAKFSRTFSRAGFIAYRTAILPGALIVLPWTNSPPVVTVNYPANGFHFAGNRASIGIDVTVRTPVTNVAKLEIATNGVLLATLTEPPYSFVWTNVSGTIPPGHYVLVVAETDRAGGTYPSRPVAVDIGSNNNISLPHALADGSFMFYYSTLNIVGQMTYYLTMYTNIPSVPSWGWKTVTVGKGDGVFVDTLAGSRPRQFYRLEGFTIPPP